MHELEFCVKNPMNIFERALSRTPVKIEYRDFLKNAYSTHGRYYHGVYHIAQILSLHYQISEMFKIQFSHNEETIFHSAAVYHDVILDPLLHDNEEQSAALWRLHRSKGEHYLHADCHTTQVENFILSTANHFAPREYIETDPDHNLREWFIGLDLASLASPPDMFQQNTLAIRAEYCHVPEEAWKAGRGGFLKVVEKTEKIYRHPIMHELFEVKARKNIEMSGV